MRAFFRFNRPRLVAFALLLLLPALTLGIPVIGIPASLLALPILLGSGLRESGELVVYWILGFYPVTVRAWVVVLVYYFLAAWVLSLPLSLGEKKPA